MKRELFLAVVAVTLSAHRLSADTILFSNGDFAPGSWTASAPFMIQPDAPGLAYAVSTTRVVGEGDNAALVQQFTITVPSQTFAGFYAPVFFSGFVHDPATGGAITDFSAAIRTFPVAPPLPDDGGFGGMRLLLMQNGRLYALSTLSPNHLTNYPEFGGFVVSDPELIRNASSVVATDFVELLPGVGVDENSFPDFAGAPIAFGFGYSMTSLDLSGDGEVVIPAGFDDVSFRINVVPSPVATTLLGLGGLAAARRRRC